MYNMEDLACYVVLKDIPSMTPGKACAQAHHAGSALIKEYPNHPFTKEWGGDLGVGTAIILKASPEEFDYYLIQELNRTIKHSDEFYLFGTYTDPTYPIKVSGKSVTIPCQTSFWLLGPRSTVRPILKGLKLY